MKIFFSMGLWILAICCASGEDLTRKLLCGYQGWFRVPTDGTNNGWHHYASGKSFEPGNCGIDLWPDVREFPLGDRVPTKFQHEDGTTAEIFSSARPSTIRTHFRWMREYGIDGIFLQRFAVTTLDPRFRKPMDRIMESCRSAAGENGRCWALMYDLSGLKPGQADIVIDDWKRLCSESSLIDPAKDTAYLRHKGKPLVALWGCGFADRPPMLEDWGKLIRFFKSDSQYGGCAVMLGVPAYWRTLDRDSITDPAMHRLLEMADVVSPWTVGRYATVAQREGHVARRS